MCPRYGLGRRCRAVSRKDIRGGVRKKTGNPTHGILSRSWRAQLYVEIAVSFGVNKPKCTSPTPVLKARLILPRLISWMFGESCCFFVRPILWRLTTSASWPIYLTPACCLRTAPSPSRRTPFSWRRTRCVDRRPSACCGDKSCHSPPPADCMPLCRGSAKTFLRPLQYSLASPLSPSLSWRRRVSPLWYADWCCLGVSYFPDGLYAAIFPITTVIYAVVAPGNRRNPPPSPFRPMLLCLSPGGRLFSS